MGNTRNRVCPVQRASSLDNRIRKWVQNPLKILSPYVQEGMTVLDLGCGPGYFTLDIAHQVNDSGRVIAADLQEGMLEKLREKIRGTALEERIVLHRCEENAIGLSESIDFVLAFYVIHEITDPGRCFRELATILRPGGAVLVVEPPFHVSKTAFLKMLKTAVTAGFDPGPGPKMRFHKTALLRLLPHPSVSHQ